MEIGTSSGAVGNAPPLLGSDPATGTRPARPVMALEIGLCFAAVLFFPLLVLVPRGIAPLASIAGLLGVGLLVATNRRPLWSQVVSVPAVLLAAIVVWGVVSAAWSPDPPGSLDQSLRLAGLLITVVAIAAAAVATAPRRLTWFLVSGFIVAIAMALIDITSSGALSRPFSDRVYQPAWLNQASVAFAILLLPTAAALILSGYRFTGLLFAAACAITILVLAGTAAKVALAAGFPCAVVSYWQRRQFTRIAAALTVLVVVTAPVTFARIERVPQLAHIVDWIKYSGGHRVLIWSFVGDRIAEHPLRGWGLDASRAIPGGRDLIRPGETWLPLHPHNAALQIWLELGVPGAALFALLAGWLWLAVGRARWPHLYAAATCGSLATALVASAATYGIWQEWWLGTLSFSLFMTMVMARVAGAAGAR
jgi:O-antigen ligase